jgi:uncharacterized protein (TIGR00290 family)
MVLWYLQKHTILSGVIAVKAVAVIVLMDTKKKITISWSGGKDSAYAMYSLLRKADVEVCHIHTVISESQRRVGLHGVREGMIELQAKQLNTPLVKAYLNDDQSGESYQRLMTDLYAKFRDDGITHILFGDIFLQDLRNYREKLLLKSGLQPIYPLWQKPSENILADFSAAGFRSVICSCNDQCFDAGILGVVIDGEFGARLPEGVDPCGENGEFHSYVFDGPIFKRPIRYTLGDTVARKYHYSITEDKNTIQRTTIFHFQDILP